MKDSKDDVCSSAAGDAPAPNAPVVTVVEPEELAPLGRLGTWLFAEGASLRVVRPWAGDAIPPPERVGDGLVVLGGAMSAHDDADHPWLADLRALLRDVVDRQVPTVTVCLGTQVAAEALGGVTSVPAPDCYENGIVDVTLTPESETDPVFGEVSAEAVRAAHRAGIPTHGGTRVPVIVSHHDAVTQLPPRATLLASSELSPIHTWRVGRLLAFQHHPESDPQRVEYWRTRDVLADMAPSMDPADVTSARAVLEAGATPSGAAETGAAGVRAADRVPPSALEAGARARGEAEAVEPVVQAFGRALARVLVRNARAHRAATA